MAPLIYELDVRPDGTVAPGRGVLAAVVPAAAEGVPVVLLSCDPRHDPGRPINTLAPAVIGWLYKKLGVAAAGIRWAVIDHKGHFSEAVPDFAKVGAGGTASAGTTALMGTASAGTTALTGRALAVEFRYFTGGVGSPAFFHAVGAELSRCRRSAWALAHARDDFPAGRGCCSNGRSPRHLQRHSD